MPVTFRWAVPEDDADLARFNEIACGVATAPGFWRWKYFENPSGASPLVLAIDNGRIVGRMGWFANRVRAGDESITIGQWSDVDVLAEYRQEGIFFPLVRMACERDGDMPVQMAFALDVTREIGTRALGFTDVGSVRSLSLHLDPFPYLARRVGLGPLFGLMSAPLRALQRQRYGRLLPAGVSLRRVAELDPRIDALRAEYASTPVALMKDAAYLDWRYARCPGSTYQIFMFEEKDALRGFVVVHLIDKEGIRYGLVDDWGCAAADVPALMAAAALELMGQGAANVITYLPGSHPAHRVLLEMGFRSRHGAHFIVRVLPAAARLKDTLVRESSWSYVLGDTDHWIFPRRSE